MPMLNEHSFRVRNPDSFQSDSFRRKNISKGIDVIMGKLKNETTMTVQAYRFDKEMFTPAECKKWMKDHDIEYMSFESAQKAEIDLKVTEHNGEVLAIKADEDIWELEILGAPFYGHRGGKDTYGEYFSPNTDFMLEVGETRPVVYYHGLNPEGKPEKLPEIIGKAEAIRTDDKGLWFKVILNKSSNLAKRIWEAAQKGLAKASTGAVLHLVRVIKSGEILKWPIGELSLIDQNLGRQAANQLAVVMPIKSLINDDYLFSSEFVEGLKLETNQVENINIQEIENLEINMENIKMDANEIKLIAEELAKINAEKEAAEKADAERVAAIKAEARKEYEAELGAKVPAWKGGFNIKKVTDLGFSKEDDEAFMYWLKTGNAVKAAMQEDTTTEGGFWVPPGFYGKIIAKRDVMSFWRGAGATVIPMTNNSMKVATEGSAAAAASVVAEEGAAVDVAPTAAQVELVAYKFFPKVTISNEMLEDAIQSMEVYLAERFGRVVALTENKYLSVGTGSGQPQGVFDVAAALTLDSASAIGAAEIPELYYKLAQPYRGDSIWLMNGTTEAYLRGLRDTSDFVFGVVPTNLNVAGTWETLNGRPVFNDSNIDEIGSTKKILAVVSPSYLMLGEKVGMSITRNPYLLQNTDQTVFYCRFRFGSIVTNEDAIKIAANAA